MRVIRHSDYFAPGEWEILRPRLVLFVPAKPYTRGSDVHGIDVRCPDCGTACTEPCEARGVIEFDRAYLEELDSWFAFRGGLWGGDPAVPTHLIFFRCPVGHEFATPGRKDSNGIMGFRYALDSGRNTR